MNTVSIRPPASWSRARVTFGIALATAAAYLLVSILGLHVLAVTWGSFIPADIATDIPFPHAPVWLTPLTATLVHANIVHLALNLLFLVFCGRPTENVLGPVGLVFLYLVGAYAAAAVQYLAGMPAIGSSGAVSAVLGAYSMLFGRNKVKVRSPKLALLLHTLWLLVAWVGLNLLVFFTFAAWFGVFVAAGAHIGGFIAGLALAIPLLLLRYRRA